MEVENIKQVPCLEKNIDEYSVTIQDILKPKPVYMETDEENTKVLIDDDTNGFFIENEILSNPSSPCERFSKPELPIYRLSEPSPPCKKLSDQQLPREILSNEPSSPSARTAKCFNFLSKKKNMKDYYNLSKKKYMEENENLPVINSNVENFKQRTNQHYDIISTNQSILEIKLFKNKRSYKRWSFFIIFTSSLLTVIEVIIKQYNIKENEKITSIYSNTILLLPLFLSFIITLTSAWIKHIKFEEIIENVTRGIEKSITAKSKLDKIKEELFFNTDININQNKDEEKKIFEDIEYRYHNDAYKHYLDAVELCDRNINVTEFPNFLKIYLKHKKIIDKYEENI